MTTPGELLILWRADIDRFEAYGQSQAASVLRQCASQLQETTHESAIAPLTLTEASAESGYSPAHLERLVRQGKIANAGRKHAPRIRRSDLPLKPGALLIPSEAVTLSDARRQAVRAVVASHPGATDAATHRKDTAGMVVLRWTMG